ncbi:MAG: hypothetical protein ACTSYX_11415 [Candidatus Thorarchaeota archaeon]
MPATRSEYKEIREDAMHDILNLLISTVSMLTKWSDSAQQWAGLAGDISGLQRLTRGDFANMRKTQIEHRIRRTLEAIEYHLLEAVKTTGREAENHLGKVKMYLQYLRRLEPAMNEVERLVAEVWPWPQVMKAALTERKEGGNIAMLSRGLSGRLKRAIETLQQASPPPPPESKEGEEDDAK